MRLKLIAGLLITVLLAAGCNITSQLYPNNPTSGKPPHWLNTTYPNGEETVLFVIDPSVPAPGRTSDGKSVDYRALIRKSANDWSAARNFKFVDGTPPNGVTCTSSSDCVLIKATDRDGGGAAWDTTVEHVRLGPYGITVTLSNRVSQMTYAFIAGMICHELGHAAGPLRHPPTGSGPCKNGLPTAWDLELVGENNKYHTH